MCCPSTLLYRVIIVSALTEIPLTALDYSPFAIFFFLAFRTMHLNAPRFSGLIYFIALKIYQSSHVPQIQYPIICVPNSLYCTVDSVFFMPQTHQNGASVLWTISSNPTSCITCFIWANVKRFSRRVPKRSNASVRIV